MKFSFSLATFLRSFPLRRKLATAPVLMHPARDWSIGVLSAFVCFMGGSAYAWLFFQSRMHGDTASSTVSTEIASYEENAIMEVLERYRARTRDFNLLRGERPSGVPAISRVEEEKSVNESMESLSAE